MTAALLLVAASRYQAAVLLAERAWVWADSTVVYWCWLRGFAGGRGR